MNTNSHSRPALCVGLTPAAQRTLWFDAIERGEVNRASRADLRLAGKGVNVAYVLQALGGTARLLAFHYRFLPKPKVSSYEGCNTSWIEVDAPTRTCTTLIEKDGTVTELVEEARLPNPDEWNRMDITVHALVSSSGAMALSGALMPGANAGIYARWMEAANRAGVPVLMDSQGESLLRSLALKPRWVKLTRAELERTLEQKIADKPLAIRKAASEICKRGAGLVFVTRGAADAIWVNAKGEHGSIKPPKVQVVNPIGAGDAVSGGMLWAYQQGLSEAEMLKWGIACGSARAAVAHTGELGPERVRQMYEDMG